ncbi:THxN family PEP-CTERM protein [Thauera butanivorans]|uniref:THxN family PEP-CTERM protein n=1 Tax=Thauera butanivorans TaxID=86174 RepID=UPI000A7F495D|nr:THxN family PEP-CTERM protein [Thauera butanivorans]
MKSRPSLKAVTALLVGLASAATVQAAPVVTDWTYTLTAVWSDYQPSGVNISGDQKTLSWGSGSSGPSSLVITDPAADGTVITQISGDSPQPGSTAAGVTLTHNNRPITGTSLTSAVLTATLNLAAAAPADAALGGPGALPPLAYQILFTETPNTAGTCAAASPPGNPCNDIFVQQGGFLNQTLTYDDNEYFINIFPIAGGVLQTLSNAACAAAGAGNGCLGFTTIEGESNQLAFGFTISTERFIQQVPEPGVLALLGLGLAAGALAGRRRRV